MITILLALAILNAIAAAGLAYVAAKTQSGVAAAVSMFNVMVFTVVLLLCYALWTPGT